jgi:saccharopine dehydrogenase-like NADP-dependent oxidoreductase
MQSVIVLGAGRVGAAMARDLARDRVLRVTVVDSSPSALRRLEATPEGGAVAMIQADLSDQGQDLAVGAVPGPMGFRTLQAVISAGVDTWTFRSSRRTLTSWTTWRATAAWSPWWTPVWRPD